VPGRVALLALLVLYVLAGKLGLQFASLHVSATPLWPPTGIALAAMLIAGYRVWPAILAGAFVVNVTTAGSAVTSLGIAAGNTLEAMLATWFVRRWAGGVAAFRSPRSIFVFAGTAGLAATAVSATIGVSTLALAGYAPRPQVAAIWLTWWLGDAAGALVLAPFLIVWATAPRLGEFRRQGFEAVATLGLVATVGTLVFGGGLGSGLGNAPIGFLCLPPAVWAAYRFGARGATTALVLLAAVAVSGTLHGHGPFAVADPNRSLLLLQAFLVTLSGTVLPLAALADELARRGASSAEHARLYRESEGQRRTAEAFAQTSHALVESLDVREMADRIVSSVRELLGGTTAIVFERDPATGAQTAIATAGEGGSEYTGVRIPSGIGAIGLAVRAQRPVVTADVTADPRIVLTPAVRSRVERTPIRAAVAVPLVTHGEILGAFLVGDRAGRTFSAHEVLLAEAFAHHAALAIRNARLYEQTADARRAAEAASNRATFLADASVVIGSTLDDEVVLARVSELAVPRMADWCAVFLREGEGPISCVTFHHREPAKTERGWRYIAAQPIAADAPHGVGKVIRTGSPELAGDVTDEMIRAAARDEEGVRMRLDIGHRSVMAVPLRIDDAVRGAIVFGRAEPHLYAAADLALAEDLARRVALAIQNAHLYRAAHEARERAERAAWQAAFLAETSRVLAASLDYDVTLDTLIRHAVPTLADWVVVHIARRDGSVRRIGPAYADPALAPLAEEFHRTAPPLEVRAGGPDISVEVLRSGRSLLISHLSRTQLASTIPDGRYRELVLRLDPKSVMIVPLVARGRTLGSLTFVSLQHARRYAEPDLTFAEEIGRRAGVAVDNARLYRQTEEARAEAEAANRAKDDFLAVLSHELRTPLNSVAGWLQILERRTVEGAQAERAMAAVERNVGILRRLIEDLLDVSRIVAGKLALERTPCDLTATIEQSIESVARDAETRSISVKTGLARGIVVEGDAVRLRQIVSNLLSNALKFTPPGGEVEVRLRCPGQRAVLTVSDTGPGIPPDVLPHVFERFRQADSSTTREHGGLGLGLAIVKHLVELHGGTVRAENGAGGRGARFTVELPIAA
jgi:signal transduction histidine kinase/integral membrane sensor domain MASE1